MFLPFSQVFANILKLTSKMFMLFKCKHCKGSTFWHTIKINPLSTSNEEFPGKPAVSVKYVHSGDLGSAPGQETKLLQEVS